MANWRAKGISLIECLCCLCIGAILCCLNTGFLERDTTQQSAKQLAHALQFARLKALEHGQAINVCFSHDGYHCQKGAQDHFIVLLQEEPILDLALKRSHVFSSLPQPITFFASGKASQNKTLKIQQGKYERHLILTHSGRVRLSS